MTIGRYVTGPVVTLYGYLPGYMGSFSPATLTGGYTVASFFETIAYYSLQSRTLVIQGFTADPGADWLIALTTRGQTMSGATASSYSYGSGGATWQWFAPTFSSIFFNATGTTTVTIEHH
jgi:hypothetical protein